MSEVRPGCPQPCKECPWRTTNQGKRHAHNFYTKANLRRLWGGLRRGERMTCHPTDPRMADFSGYERTADATVTHECAGSVIVVQREFVRFQDCAEEADRDGKNDGITRYRKQHPKGLLKEGIMEICARFVFGGSALDPLEMALPNLNTPGIGHPDLPAWEPRKEKDG